MKKIPLTRGQFALVSDEDYERVSASKWYVMWNGYTFYARRIIYNQGKGETLLMHRFILDAPSGTEVDHKDGNGLNNTRENIHIGTASDNQHNRLEHRANSIKLGTTYHKRAKKYQAQAYIHGKMTYLGLYATKEEANKAYLRHRGF